MDWLRERRMELVSCLVEYIGRNVFVRGIYQEDPDAPFAHRIALNSRILVASGQRRISYCRAKVCATSIGWLEVEVRLT